MTECFVCGGSVVPFQDQCDKCGALWPERSRTQRFSPWLGESFDTQAEVRRALRNGRQR